jgi:hypothetical protein
MDVSTVRDFALLIWGNGLVKAVLGLLAANVAAGVAAALYTRTFRLAALGDWLATRAVPYLLGAATMQLVLLTLPAEWGGVSEAAANAVWLFVCAALVGHVLDALRTMGLPVPPILTDLPTVPLATRSVPIEPPPRLAP